MVDAGNMIEGNTGKLKSKPQSEWNSYVLQDSRLLVLQQSLFQTRIFYVWQARSELDDFLVMVSNSNVLLTERKLPILHLQ